jgi:glutaredoxin
MAFFALQSFAVADFYKWEDEEGNIHITDYRPPGRNIKILEVRKDEDIPKDICIRPIKDNTSQQSSEQNKSVRNEDNEVILYATSWCPSCTRARNFFNSRNIDFTEYDVEKDREAAQKFRQLNKQGGVPFVIINGQSILGYSESAYNSALR